MCPRSLWRRVVPVRAVGIRRLNESQLLPLKFEPFEPPLLVALKPIGIRLTRLGAFVVGNEKGTYFLRRVSFTSKELARFLG